MGKVQWNSIHNKQNGLKYSKNDKSSTVPWISFNKISFSFPLKNAKHWNRITHFYHIGVYNSLAAIIQQPNNQPSEDNY